MSDLTPYVPGLNYTLPVFNTAPAAAIYQTLSIVIGEVGGPAYRALKIRDGIDMLAALYVQTNGTASLDQLAAAMDSTADQVALLPEHLEGEQSLKQLVLWASIHWDSVMDFDVDVSILALVVVFSFVSIVTTGVRMYSRWSSPKGLKALDYIFGLGFLVTMVMAGIWGSAVVMLSNQGSGAVWNVTYNQYVRTQLNAFLLTTLYHAAVGLIKCPILLFYYDITPYRYQRIILVVILFLCAANNLAGFFFNIFKYYPVDIWNHRLQDNGSDYNVRLGEYRDEVIWIIGAANIVFDCLIWTMPIHSVLKMGKNWKAKAAALAIVLSGALPSIFSILRAISIANGNINSTNGSLSEWQVNVYSLVEIHIMIWCFNIPAIRALFVSIAERRRRHHWYTPDHTKGSSDNGSAKESTDKNSSMVSFSSRI